MLFYNCSWQCSGSGVYIQGPIFFIPGPDQKGTVTRILIRNKEFDYFLTRKFFTKLLWVPDPGFAFFFYSDPGPRVKKTPDPGSCIASIFNPKNFKKL